MADQDLTPREIATARQLADDFVLRRGRPKAEAWARHALAVGGGPYWQEVLRRVLASVPRRERHVTMAGMLRPTGPREEPFIRGRPLS